MSSLAESGEGRKEGSSAIATYDHKWRIYLRHTSCAQHQLVRSTAQHQLVCSTAIFLHSTVSSSSPARRALPAHRALAAYPNMSPLSAFYNSQLGDTKPGAIEALCKLLVGPRPLTVPMTSASTTSTSTLPTTSRSLASEAGDMMLGAVCTNGQVPVDVLRKHGIQPLPDGVVTPSDYFINDQGEAIPYEFVYAAAGARCRGWAAQPRVPGRVEPRPPPGMASAACWDCRSRTAPSPSAPTRRPIPRPASTCSTTESRPTRSDRDSSPRPGAFEKVDGSSRPRSAATAKIWSTTTRTALPLRIEEKRLLACVVRIFGIGGFIFTWGTGWVLTQIYYSGTPHVHCNSSSNVAFGRFTAIFSSNGGMSLLHGLFSIGRPVCLTGWQSMGMSLLQACSIFTAILAPTEASSLVRSTGRCVGTTECNYCSAPEFVMITEADNGSGLKLFSNTSGSPFPLS